MCETSVRPNLRVHHKHKTRTDDGKGKKNHTSIKQHICSMLATQMFRVLCITHPYYHTKTKTVTVTGTLLHTANGQPRQNEFCNPHINRHMRRSALLADRKTTRTGAAPQLWRCCNQEWMHSNCLDFRAPTTCNDISSSLVDKDGIWTQCIDWKNNFRKGSFFLEPFQHENDQEWNAGTHTHQDRRKRNKRQTKQTREDNNKTGQDRVGGCGPSR